MQQIWFYQNDKGERARIILSGSVTIACIGNDQCRFPSFALADKQLSIWGYKKEEKTAKQENQRNCKRNRTEI